MLFGFRMCGGSGTYWICVSLHERNTFICGTYPHIPTSLCRRLSDCPRADPDAPAALHAYLLLHRYTATPVTAHDTAHTHGPWTHAHTTLDGDLESDTLMTLSTHTSEDPQMQLRLRWWTTSGCVGGGSCAGGRSFLSNVSNHAAHQLSQQNADRDDTNRHEYVHGRKYFTGLRVAVRGASAQVPVQDLDYHERAEEAGGEQR